MREDLYLQLLEGPADAVEAAYARIARITSRRAPNQLERQSRFAWKEPNTSQRSNYVTAGAIIAGES